MTTDGEKEGQRIAGTALQVAARLIETPGPSVILYRLATKQLGVDRLRDAAIPEHATPYRPTHLASRPTSESEEA